MNHINFVFVVWALIGLVFASSDAHFFPVCTLSPNQKSSVANKSLLSMQYSVSGQCKLSNSLISIRGGSDSMAFDKENSYSLRGSVVRNILGLWGVAQVVSVLCNAIKRLLPVALQPFQQMDLLPYHWALYAVWCVYMVYTEGYKAFQCKFSPYVVERAFNLYKHASNPLNLLLAGPYSMGMFNASKKRMIVSWAITTMVFGLVKVVKYLPYPYRSIVDGGVVLGLSYGALTILGFAVKVLLGGKGLEKLILLDGTCTEMIMSNSVAT